MIGCLAAVFECLPVSEVAWSQSLFKTVKPFPASSFPLELKGFSFYLGRHLCPLQRSEAPACRGCGGGWKSVAYCCRWQAPISELVSGKEKTGRHQNLRNGIRRTYTCCTPYVFSGVVSKPGCPLWSSEGFWFLFLKNNLVILTKSGSGFHQTRPGGESKPSSAQLLPFPGNASTHWEGAAMYTVLC